MNDEIFRNLGGDDYIYYLWLVRSNLGRPPKCTMVEDGHICLKHCKRFMWLLTEKAPVRAPNVNLG